MSHTHTPVLIIGAGPTGLSLSAQLTRFGIAHTLCDQKSGPTELSKALVVHARTLEIYDQMGLALKAVEQGSQVRHWAMLHQGEVKAQLDFDNIGAGMSPFPFVLVYEQSKNEHLLCDYLKQQQQDILWNTGLESLQMHETGVEATLTTQSGETLTLTADYIVGCDGAGSRVRELMNMPFGGATLPRHFYVADVKMPFPSQAHTLYMTLNEDAFMLLAPMAGEHHWRLIGNLPQVIEPHPQENYPFEDLKPLIENLLAQKVDIQELYWYSNYRVHTRHAETFQSGRCFLAGDAAHVHTPAGGQGMNTGIQDAYNLAWKLWWVLQHKANPAVLDTYNTERLANAKNLLKSTDRAFNMVVSDLPFLRQFRDHVLPKLAGFVTRLDPVKEFVFPILSQTGIHYPQSELSQRKTDVLKHVLAGDRLPWFKVQGKSIYAEMATPRFHLLLLDDGSTHAQPLIQALNENHGQWLRVHHLPLYPLVCEKLGVHQSAVVLLRPDLHVVLSAHLHDAEATLAEFAKRWLTRG